MTEMIDLKEELLLQFPIGEFAENPCPEKRQRANAKISGLSFFGFGESFLKLCDDWIDNNNIIATIAISYLPQLHYSEVIP